ncbi:hypothetical protein LCGC14_0948470 [marine sediment metagenome]|uniref:Uncharacterized protein n=1 Tax=marine sediment metagenome TaxID=412755 RepID=A0A0F9R1H4_9ZZZZ
MVKKKKEIKEPEVSLNQIISDREVSIGNEAETIACWTEELKYKENQMDSEIVEENVSTLYNLVSFPKDKTKPRHVLKIEIEMLKRQIKKKKKILKIMQELQVEDEKNATKSS